MRAFIALGSNLGDRMDNLRRALGQLNCHGVRVVAASPVYETAPVGPPQPDYLNAVAEIETELAPRRLLQVLKQAEAAVGRRHRQRWGPREIDLDILLYEGVCIKQRGLQIPHPRLTERPFVLVPLLELDPAIQLPSGEPLAAYLAGEPAGVRRFAGSIEAAG